MSATNRQRKPRDPFDFNRTPKKLANAMCNVWLPIPATGVRILDPSAGDGVFPAVLRNGRPGAHIEAIELQPRLPGIEVSTREHLFSLGASRVWIADYLSWRNRDPAGLGFASAGPEERPLFDWVVGNPPYSKPTGRYSEKSGNPIMEECVGEHVRRSMALLRPGGQLAFLLRLNWSVPKSRDRLLAEFPIKRVLPLKERPSFRGGPTDATDYAVHWWQKGWSGETTWARMDGGPWGD